MYRIDNPDAATSLPVPGPPGTPGWFTGGNPQAGQAATIVDADWLNAVQEEIAHCIEQSGLALSKTDRTQLWRALQQMYGAPVGQCRLRVGSGTQLYLLPYKGRFLTINGLAYPIPQSGVLLSNAGLAAASHFFVYAFMNAGVMTLEASATGHSQDTSPINYGVEIKTGDPTRTLVGQIYTGSGGTFVDSTTQRGCANWFNRRIVQCNTTFSGSTGSVYPAWADITGGAHIGILTWGDEVLNMSAMGQTSNDTGLRTNYFSLAGDGAIEPGGQGGVTTSSTTGTEMPMPLHYSGIPATEGYHDLYVVGATNGGTATFNAVFYDGLTMM